MSVKDGGPAFPGEPEMRFGQSNEYNQGMTLRDYFAAKAMQGPLAGNIYNPGQADLIAKDSKAIADAMIAAKETK